MAGGKQRGRGEADDGSEALRASAWCCKQRSKDESTLRWAILPQCEGIGEDQGVRAGLVRRLLEGSRPSGMYYPSQS